MDNKNDFYEKFNSESHKSKSIGTTVLIPFLCGILGAVLVVGIVFGAPNIRNALFSNNTGTTNNQNSNNTGVVDYVSLNNYSDTAVYAASKVLPSIVGIKVEYTVTSNFSQSLSQVAQAEGSGIIMSSDGYILTNNHIINSADSSIYYEVSEATNVYVYLYNDETPYEAKIIGTDEETDLAVIKIDKTDLTPVEVGDSDSIKIGEFAMAIGNPLGMESSVTSGIISAVNRTVSGSDGNTHNLIQTDAAINAGNSGGALVNSQGQVIGINTLKASGEGVEGLGFAIPINDTKDIYSDLIQYSKVKRPYIGITGSDITEETVAANPTFDLRVGAYVRGVEDYSPAEKAGLRIGDIIIEADGQTVETMDDLNEIKNSHQIGDTMSLKIYRSGQESTVELTLAEQP